jgi:S1-C subfamily serine protease
MSRRPRPAKMISVVALLSYPILSVLGQQASNLQPLTAVSASLNPVIEAIRPSIVKIICVYRFHSKEEPTKEATIESSSTGFILDNLGHIATAGHVVSRQLAEADITRELASRNQHLDGESLVRTEIEVRLPSPSKDPDEHGNNLYNLNDDLSATVVGEDDLVDVAVLKCAANPVTTSSGISVNGRPTRPPAKVPTLLMDRPLDGDMIAVSGFPLGIPVLTTNVGWIATAYWRDQRERSLYLASVLINHGDSGSPVYLTTNGKIIGCVTEYRPAPEGNSGLAVIVPIQRFIELLANAPPS